jgi:hypothetical protein
LAERYPILVGFQHPGGPPPVTEVRSTLLTASMQSLRTMGLEARYFDALPADRHAEIRALVPGIWVPIALAEAHYRACDRLAMDAKERERMGESVATRTQGTFIDTLGKVAAGAGATPWNFLSNAHRIWARMMNGGDHCVYEVGPKDALIVLVGCRLLSIPYFRDGIRAYYRAIALPLARTVYANEVARYRGATSFGLQMSWA